MKKFHILAWMFALIALTGFAKADVTSNPLPLICAQASIVPSHTIDRPRDKLRQFAQDRRPSCCNAEVKTCCDNSRPK